MRSVSLDAPPVGMLFANTTFTVSSVVPIIAPSVNLNGIIIRTLILAQNGGSAGVTGTAIYADTAAPSANNDLTKRIIFASSVNPNSTLTTVMPNPVHLYPGLGLWVGGGAASSGFVYVTYDLLVPESR